MLSSFFAAEQIECFGVLPFSACRVRRADILERRGAVISELESAILFLIPYYVGDGEGNISLYARSGDYHFYSEALFARLIPGLEARFGGKFYGFADKSPIEETVAASMAGLGVVGDNYMLIHERYGSFVFIGEIFSTVKPEAFGTSIKVGEVRTCMHCGACKKACPMAMRGMDCLSAVTQKKGELDEEERAYIKAYGTAWGCDLCQLACPYNKKAMAKGVETPIEFFHHDRISTLTTEILEAMDKETFSRRSFSWRGKAPLLRNLEILGL